MLVELLRPAGVELARRWVAALLLAPEHEREGVVSAIERRMTELYAPTDGSRTGVDAGDELVGAGLTRQVRVVLPPRDRGGFVEQLIRTYEVVPAQGKPPAKARRGAT